MAVEFPDVNRKGPIIIGFFAALLLGAVFCSSAPAQEGFRIKPVEKASDLSLLPAKAWPALESDRAELLLKFYYLRGLLDALQYTELAPQSTLKVLKTLEGMDLNGLAAEVDRYYLKNPGKSRVPPAAVVLKLLPEQKAARELNQ